MPGAGAPTCQPHPCSVRLFSICLQLLLGGPRARCMRRHVAQWLLTHPRDLHCAVLLLVEVVRGALCLLGESHQLVWGAGHVGAQLGHVRLLLLRQLGGRRGCSCTATDAGGHRRLRGALVAAAAAGEHAVHTQLAVLGGVQHLHEGKGGWQKKARCTYGSADTIPVRVWGSCFMRLHQLCVSCISCLTQHRAKPHSNPMLQQAYEGLGWMAKHTGFDACCPVQPHSPPTLCPNQNPSLTAQSPKSVSLALSCPSALLTWLSSTFSGLMSLSIQQQQWRYVRPARAAMLRAGAGNTPSECTDKAPQGR
jgi:hypothetical protein